MKKLFLILLVGIIAGSLFAGGAKEGAAADGTKLFKFASNSTSTVNRPATKIFLDEIEKNGGGMFKVERYTEGELYTNAEEMLAATQSNIIQGTCEGDMSLSWASPQWISWTSVPFCFSNNEHFFKFFMGEKGKEIQAILESKHSLHFLDSAIGARGPRMLTANKPIRTPQEMQGLKFRVPNVIGTVASWEAMGTKVIGVPWAELFNALQTGLVDAQENPFAELDSGAFYQVQTHIMETAHQIGPQFFLVNADFWKGLTPAQQKIFNDANKKGMDYFNAETVKADAALRQKFLAAGKVIVPTSEIDIEAFKKIIADQIVTNANLTKDWAPGGWDYIQSLR